eukprot:357557-Chlamydomonas_euryale.AAC.2
MPLACRALRPDRVCGVRAAAAAAATAHHAIASSSSGGSRTPHHRTAAVDAVDAAAALPVSPRRTQPCCRQPGNCRIGASACPDVLSGTSIEQHGGRPAAHTPPRCCVHVETSACVWALLERVLLVACAQVQHRHYQPCRACMYACMFFWRSYRIYARMHTYLHAHVLACMYACIHAHVLARTRMPKCTYDVLAHTCKRTAAAMLVSAPKPHTGGQPAGQALRLPTPGARRGASSQPPRQLAASGVGRVERVWTLARGGYRGAGSQAPGCAGTRAGSPRAPHCIDAVKRCALYAPGC